MKVIALASNPLLLVGLMVTLVACGNQAEPVPTVAEQPTLEAATPTAAPVAAGPDVAVAAQDSPTLLEDFRGDVLPNAQSIFGFTGQVGQAVRIEARVLSGQPDISLELSIPNGGVLARVDQGGAGEPEVIGEFRLPADGYYELGIGTQLEGGQIQMLVFALPEEALSGGGSLPGFGQPVTGSMDRPATIHSFKIQVERGQRFDIRATALSGDLDLLFELYDPQGEPIASRDDSLNLDPYLFNLMPDKGGEYTIVLTNYEQTTGTYELVAGRSQSSGQLATGRNQTIALPTQPHHGVWLDFIANAGEGLRVDAEPISPQVDLTLGVFDVFGNQLAFTDLGGPGVGERLEVQVPYDGPFQLEFGTLAEGGQVRYDVIPRTQADFDDKGPVLGFRTVRTYPLDLSDIAVTHAYWFDGEQDQRITLDGTVTAGSMDLAFDLYDQAGNLISAHDDDRGRDPVLEAFPLPYTGRYYVVFRVNGPHRGGEYRLVADSPAPPVRADTN